MMKLRCETVQGRQDCHLSLPSDYRFPPKGTDPILIRTQQEMSQPDQVAQELTLLNVSLDKSQRLTVSLLITRPEMSPCRALPFVVVFSPEAIAVAQRPRSGHDLIKTNWRSWVEPRPPMVPYMTCTASWDVQKEADLKSTHRGTRGGGTTPCRKLSFRVRC